MTNQVEMLLNGFSGEVCSSRIHATFHQTLTHEALRQAVSEWTELFGTAKFQGGAIAILADNSPEWVAADLAAASVNTPIVPLPDFFTDDQLIHLVVQSAVGWIVTDKPQRAELLGFEPVLTRPRLRGLHWMRRDSRPGSLPHGVQKVTFTSGTTGQPKGVCLSFDQQLDVARALCAATDSLNIKTHLCLLPLSVLLENVAGVYAPMLAGARLVVPPQDEVGIKGAASFDANLCLDAIERYQAESLILLPQMLFALVQATRMGDERTKSLKFIAVGGGKVPENLLQVARAIGLPVYEGYGLSECASVVCLNTPDNLRIGTVGKPLSGLQVRVDQSREVWVKGRNFMGYLGDNLELTGLETDQDGWMPTGDLGEFDQDGFLTLHGRKKNLIITSLGRNISPEWPEGLLLATGAFLQAVVFGEGQTSLSAVVVPRMGTTKALIEKTIAQVNTQLPDYARISQFVVASEPFSFQNGLATANGRIRRGAIWSAYGEELARFVLQGVV